MSYSLQRENSPQVGMPLADEHCPILACSPSDKKLFSPHWPWPKSHRENQDWPSLRQTPIPESVLSPDDAVPCSLGSQGWRWILCFSTESDRPCSLTEKWGLVWPKEVPGKTCWMHKSIASAINLLWSFSGSNIAILFLHVSKDIRTGSFLDVSSKRSLLDGLLPVASKEQFFCKLHCIKSVLISIWLIPALGSVTWKQRSR